MREYTHGPSLFAIPGQIYTGSTRGASRTPRILRTEEPVLVHVEIAGRRAGKQAEHRQLGFSLMLF